MEGVAEEAELAAEVVEAATALGDGDEALLVDSIELVADDRVADLGEVDADLVLATGKGGGAHEGDGLAPEGAGGEGPDLGAGGEAPLLEGPRAHLDADPRAEGGAEGEVDAARGFELAVDQRPVDLVDGAAEEGALEVAAAAAAAAEDEDAGGLAVDAVGELPAVPLAEAGAEEVREGVAVVAGGGVDGETGGLVEDEEVGVLVEHGVVEDDRGLARGGALDHEALAEADPLGGAAEGLAGVGAADAAGVDDLLDAGAGEAGDPAGDEAIEAEAGPRRVDLEGDEDERFVAVVHHRARGRLRRVWYAPPAMSTNTPPSAPEEQGSPLPAIIAGVAILAVAAFLIFGSSSSTTATAGKGKGEIASQGADQAGKTATDASGKVRGGVEARAVDEAKGRVQYQRNPALGTPVEGMQVLPEAPKKPDSFPSKEAEISYYEKVLVAEQALLDKRTEFVKRAHQIRADARTPEEKQVAESRTKIVEDNLEEQKKVVDDLEKKLGTLKGK